MGKCVGSCQDHCNGVLLGVSELFRRTVYSDPLQRPRSRGLGLPPIRRTKSDRRKTMIPSNGNSRLALRGTIALTLSMGLLGFAPASAQPQAAQNVAPHGALGHDSATGGLLSDLATAPKMSPGANAAALPPIRPLS